MAINTTPGDAAADGYVSEADADAYMLTRVGTSTWDSATTAEKEAAIKHATRLLDLLDWVGDKYFDDGALRWPRDGVTDPDGITLDNSTIPVFLENATAEYALVLIRDGDITANPSSAGLERIKVDVIELEYDTTGSNPTQNPEALPDSVMSMIEFYLRGSLFAMSTYRT